MDSLYEWLFAHYCRPRMDEVVFSDPYITSQLRAARALLLSGQGDRLDREDALDFLALAQGMVAFALGLDFCRRLTAEITFPQP